jgi:hypothetical protein
MRRVKSGEATPMKMIATAIGDENQALATVEASGSVRFFSTVTSPSATRW